MKKIVLLILLSFTICCSKDDKSIENQQYLDELLGFYKLKAAYVENSIDLNGDGIEGTNLFEEVEYCNMSKQLESYWCTIVDRNTQTLNFDIPFSNHYNNFQNYSNCLQHKGVFRELDIDSKNENVTLVPNEYEEDFMLTFQAKLIEFTWEDRIAYLTLEKEFYTPDEVWKTVILHMEYEWESSQI